LLINFFSWLFTQGNLDLLPMLFVGICLWIVSWTNTPKKLHSYIKSQKNENTGIAPLRSEGTLHSNPSEKANILNKQLQSAFIWVVFIPFFEYRRDICVVPVSNDLVNNKVRMSVHISILSFSTLPAMVSGPVALLGFMFFMSL
jgi:hypothetical protein